MEIIPALGLLLLVTSLSARLMWLAAENRLAGERLRLEGQARSYCLTQVEPGMEEVFLVWQDASGDWQLRRFPDSSWLPGSGAERPGSTFRLQWVLAGSDASMEYWALQTLD